MKLPINWLKEYVDVPSQLTELTDQLTAIGHMQDKPPAEVAGDTVLDLEIRQNRSDCLCVVGLAREAAAVLKSELRMPAAVEAKLPALSSDQFIQIEAPDTCYRFHALVFENIKVGPSPKWLVDRLEAYGIRSINNLVDVTNFVMVELGEPLHAFDRDLIDQGIVIRFAKKGEQLEVLGSKVLKLTGEDLVIADHSKVLALGGMIGGLESAISEKTTRIVLEAATYRQASIRRSSLRHSLRTEASLRHEKFLHPYLTEIALRRAAELIQELCGGKVVEHFDAYPNPVKDVTLTMRVKRLNDLGGLDFSIEEAEQILNRLGIETKKSGENLECVVPYFRTDIEQEEDLIEEVLRIHGYDKIPDHLPNTPPPKDLQSDELRLEDEIRNILVACGFDEQITEPLTRETVPVREPVTLQNSLNSDKTMLRTTLKNQLLYAVDYQKKFHKSSVSVFEIGKVYFKEGDEYREPKMVAGVMMGPGVTYFHLKGVVEALFDHLGYEFDESIVSLVGVNAHTFYFEFMLEDLKNLMAKNSSMIRTSFAQIVYQDVSLSVPKDVKVGDVIRAAQESSPLVRKVSLGEQPREMGDRKSVFLNIQYHDPEKQLSAKDVEPVQGKIVDRLKSDFGAQLR